MPYSDSGQARDRDSPDEAPPVDRRRFVHAVAPLAEGELTFRPPFDHASSVALARNVDGGTVAENRFDSDRVPSSIQIHVCVVECSDVIPGQNRELIDTVAATPAAAIVLLRGLITELAALTRPDPDTPT